MNRKFIGYIEYAWDDFNIFGRDSEKAVLDIVEKTLELSKKYDDIHYGIIKDTPHDAIVFSAKEFTLEEGEKWYEMWSTEEEQFVYGKLKECFDSDYVGVLKHNTQEVLDGGKEEYVVERDDVTLIIRFDKILVLSNNQEFINFSISSEKIYRWFLG